MLMGVLGKQLLGRLGGSIGNWAGKKFGKRTGVGAERGMRAGSSIGETLGDLLPFKKGGRVPKTGKIYAHKGEFILPSGVKPTAKQVKAVRKRGGRVKKAKRAKKSKSKK